MGQFDNISEEEKESRLKMVEQDIIGLDDYKTKLQVNPYKEYNDRLNRLEKTLTKNLGTSMRNHLTEVLNKLKTDGENKYIEVELTRTNSKLVEANVEKDELISG